VNDELLMQWIETISEKISEDARLIAEHAKHCEDHFIKSSVFSKWLLTNRLKKAERSLRHRMVDLGVDRSVAG